MVVDLRRCRWSCNGGRRICSTELSLKLSCESGIQTTKSRLKSRRRTLKLPEERWVLEEASGRGKVIV